METNDLQLIHDLAKQFVTADIAYYETTKQMQKKYPHGRWRHDEGRAEKEAALRPINSSRKTALLELKKRLCGWEPKKKGGVTP